MHLSKWVLLAAILLMVMGLGFFRRRCPSS
jgi:hypothetical protein